MKVNKNFTSSREGAQQTMSAARYGMGFKEWSIVAALVAVEVAVVLLSARWVISML